MLSIHSLALMRGDRVLLRDLSLTIQAGQALYVRGRNGIGKTTLLRTMCGLTPPELGEVRWQGQALRKRRDDFHAALCFVGHAPGVSDALTPLENLLFTCRVAGDAVTPSACAAALADLGLAAQCDLPCKVLSQGQRRRVSLARLALAQRRSVWILDEPFASLDGAAVERLAASMQAHCARGGAIVYTSHQEVELACAQQVLDLEAFAA